MSLHTDAIRAKKTHVPKVYTCPVCARASQYPGLCSNTCRQQATPAQAKPYIAGAPVSWSAAP